VQYTQNAPKMSGLLDKLRFINDTILALPDAMDTAYTSLADAKSNMVSLPVECAKSDEPAY
jgi:hypothetical protein